MPARARPPSSRSSAWASTVLPAPVSPVSTFSPGASRSCARSISRRFSTFSSCSTAGRCTSARGRTWRGCLSERGGLTMMGDMRPGNLDLRADPLPEGAIVCLSAAALAERIEEEINRAGRHGTPLSCLLVVIENLDELTRAHGERAVRADARLRGRGAAARAAPLRPCRAAQRARARGAAARRRRAARGDRRPARAAAPARDQGRSRRTAPAAARLGRARRLARGRRRRGAARPDAGPPRAARTASRRSRHNPADAFGIGVVAAAADGRSRPCAARRRARCWS